MEMGSVYCPWTIGITTVPFSATTIPSPGAIFHFHHFRHMLVFPFRHRQLLLNVRRTRLGFYSIFWDIDGITALQKHPTTSARQMQVISLKYILTDVGKCDIMSSSVGMVLADMTIGTCRCFSEAGDIDKWQRMWIRMFPKGLMFR